MQKLFRFIFTASTIVAFAIPLNAQGERMGTEVTLSTVKVGDAGLDAGGEMESSHTSLGVAFDWSRGRGESWGISLGASLHDYDFSGANSTFPQAPWDEVTEYSVGLSWRKPSGDDGMWFVAPSIGFSRADGADWGESVKFGSIISYGHRFSETLTIGFGAGVYNGLEEFTGFPVLLVDWQISENWRLGNPFRPGPTGPAGLELVYSFNPGLKVAVGGGWRTNRFRLAETGSHPDGIGEVEGFPAFLRLTWIANETISLDLYGGKFLSGELIHEDSAGKEIATDDLDSATMAALSISAAF